MELNKTFINPETGKEWHIEITGHQVRSRLGNGKIKEMVYDNDYDTENKSTQEIMAKMRKGFIYQNPDAPFGEAVFHAFVGKSYTGFMPIGASVMKDDFYVTRVVGDFEDELLWHFGKNGELLDKFSLGAKRLTYNQVLCADNTLLLNNSYLIERFFPDDNRITPFANQRDSMKTMLDCNGELTLWYDGEKFVVYNFLEEREVWSESVECELVNPSRAKYYCKGIVSPQKTKVMYRAEEAGYTVVDIRTSKKIFIKNDGSQFFFSPDDKYVSINGRFYDSESGEKVSDPVSFDIPNGSVRINGQIMAASRTNWGREKMIGLWDYSTGEQLAEIDDIFAVKRTSFEFTKNRLILHSDWGAVSIYNCSR